MKPSLLFIALVMLCHFSYAQIGIGTTSPHVSSMVDITSTNKGLLPPRMNSTQRKAIATPSRGLIVYDITTKSFWYFDGMWREMSSNVNSDSSFVFMQGSAPSFNMSAGLNISDSAGYIYDSGGPIGGYGNNENISTFINFPQGSQLCRVQVISLNTEANLDSLRIFIGSNSYTLSGNISNQSLFFGYSYSPITLQFISNPSSTLAGFQIRFDHYFLNSTSVTNLSSTNTGFYYIPEKIAVRGGFQTYNYWDKSNVGVNSFSYGYGNKVNGDYAFASGLNTIAEGIGAVATGVENNAVGNFSSVTGLRSSALGQLSFASGIGSIAKGYASTVIGTFNDTILTVNETVPSSSTPLLIVGNGNDNFIRSNAFVVRKNGNVTIANYISKEGGNLGLQMLSNGGMRVVTTNECSGCSNTIERFKFDVNGGFVAKGILGVGTVPATGTGERVMWHPYKAAFRAGSIGTGNDFWDDYNVGFYTTAFGYNTRALGLSAFASGYQAQAIGSYSSALGYNCIADGTGAVAIGYRCTADADYSLAFGQRASTNGRAGAMVFCDGSTTDSVEASANNQLSMRFAGGYRLFTNATKTVGVQMAAGGNSWAVISDARKKENYLSASTTYFLDKLSDLKLGSWNYIGQDPTNYRHYGPMAQEIFAAFGKDKFGTIGCDTLLASADMDGIMMIMLQGLEKRTKEQSASIKELKEENNMLKEKLMKVEQLEGEIKKLSARLPK